MVPINIWACSQEKKKKTNIQKLGIRKEKINSSPFHINIKLEEQHYYIK